MSITEEQRESIYKIATKHLCKQCIGYGYSWCPYSRTAEYEISTNKIGKFIYLDRLADVDGEHVFDILSKKYEHYTVPLIFDDGDFVGGCDQFLSKLEAIKQKEQHRESKEANKHKSF